MEIYTHSINALFVQLGLDGTDEAIEKFVSEHKPLQKNIFLYDASFWNRSQATFLKEAISDDSDWVSAVDNLDSMLR